MAIYTLLRRLVIERYGAQYAVYSVKLILFDLFNGGSSAVTAASYHNGNAAVYQFYDEFNHLKAFIEMLKTFFAAFSVR